MGRILKTGRFDSLQFIKKIKKKSIETEDISKYLGCSVRFIQKWSKENNIKYIRIHGRKYYIWNKINLKKFEIWYNNKIDNKKKKIRYRKKPKPKIIKEHKEITFTTIWDLVGKEYYNIWEKKNKENMCRYIQIFCKKNNVPFEYNNGRKYYIISDEIKSIIPKKFLLKK